MVLILIKELYPPHISVRRPSGGSSVNKGSSAPVICTVYTDGALFTAESVFIVASDISALFIRCFWRFLAANSTGEQNLSKTERWEARKAANISICVSSLRRDRQNTQISLHSLISGWILLWRTRWNDTK